MTSQKHACAEYYGMQQRADTIWSGRKQYIS